MGGQRRPADARLRNGQKHSVSRKLRVLFVHARLWPYVEKDLRILQERYEVRDLLFSGTRRSLPALARGVRWADVTFCWFAKLHAFYTVLLSRAFGKRSVVVTGGDDVASRDINGYKYGLCAHPLKRLFPETTCVLADRLLAVSQSNRAEVLENLRIPTRKVTVVYHGFDPAVYCRAAGVQKDGTAGIVIAQINRENWFVKRPDLFVRAASHLPHISFKVVGPVEDPTWGSRIHVLAPTNVQFVGGRMGREYVDELTRTTVLVQPSEWESFGSSIAEGMLCECAPVIFPVGALPEVVGDCGVYVQEHTPEALARGIAEALRRPELGPRARQRIIECFPLEKRRRELLAIMDALTD